MFGSDGSPIIQYIVIFAVIFTVLAAIADGGSGDGDQGDGTGAGAGSDADGALATTGSDFPALPVALGALALLALGVLALRRRGVVSE